eukprot:72369-Chlamydomonas_euryale.AAC.1
MDERVDEVAHSPDAHACEHVVAVGGGSSKACVNRFPQGMCEQVASMRASMRVSMFVSMHMGMH